MSPSTSSARPHHDGVLRRRPTHDRARAPVPAGRVWIQADCALAPAVDGGPPPAPLAELGEVLHTWRDEGQVDKAFFVRKPPGLRIRLLPSTGGSGLRRRFEAWLHEVETQGRIKGWHAGVYEPETVRFGGPAGIELAHQLFDADTTAALRFEALSSDASRQLFSLAVTTDLVSRCLGDVAELRDVFERLSGGLRAYDVPDVPAPAPELVLDAMRGDTSFFPEGVAALLADTREANAGVAAGIAAAVASGRFETGLRGWLADVTVFHWNRMGLLVGDIRSTIDAATALLRPDP